MVGTVLATLLSLYQIGLQTAYLCRPNEQRYIIRILLMLPVYAISNLLQVIYYYQATYYACIGTAYAAVGLAAFCELIISYADIDLRLQRDNLRSLAPKPWTWPMSWLRKCTGGERGGFRTTGSGLTYFQKTFVGIFQYCFVLFTTSILAMCLHAGQRYCQASLDPAFGHVWLISFDTLSATISGYCLPHIHNSLKEDLSGHETSLKFFCVEIVLYLATYQDLLIGILLEAKVIRASTYLGTSDLSICLPSTILSVEMAIVALLHLRAYPSAVYKEHMLNPDDHHATSKAFRCRASQTGKAIWDAIDLRDVGDRVATCGTLILSRQPGRTTNICCDRKF